MWKQIQRRKFTVRAHILIAPTQEESKAKLLTKLNDVMATLDNAVAILQEIPVLQDEISHFLNESKVFNDVYDEVRALLVSCTDRF